MLQLDDVQLYDLSEAGALLFKDGVRLTREARLGAIPSALLEAGLGLPVPWVEAESGRSGADPASLSSYWLGRLAPPSRRARRPRRNLAQLETQDLLDAEAAAEAICATPKALYRLDAQGVLPSLRVMDAPRYDAQLVDLLARSHEDAGVLKALAARRAQVREWARFEYDEAIASPPADDEAPKAFEIPEGLLEADGFETVDED